MLALRLFWRNWRGGEFTLLALALILAVAVVGSIAIFTDRLENSLVRQSHEYLGANKVIRSSSERPESWQQLAFNHRISTATTAAFASMVFANDEMHLASVKAVSESYPLLGELTVSESFPVDNDLPERVRHGPASGEVWVAPRLLSLLNITLGDVIQLGSRELKVTKLLINEPDSSGMPSLLGARVMMNYIDLASTAVIQPGSRVNYRWLLAAEPSSLKRFLLQLEPELSSQYVVQDSETSQQGLGRTLLIAKQFLLMAASIAVLLSGVAIAISARSFAAKQVDQVALFKSLGLSRGQLRFVYGFQLLLLGLVATVFGLIIAEALQQFIVYMLADLLPLALLPADGFAYGAAMLTGFITLIGFVTPPLWFLPTVPPVKVLRREIEVKGVHRFWQLMIGVVVLLLLVGVFTRDLILTAVFFSVLLSIIVAVAAISAVLFWLADRYARKIGNIWRLAFANLNRYRYQSYLQIGVFSVAIMLLLSLTAIRTQLIDDWQMQLPAKAPNHFLLNIADYELEPINRFFSKHELASKGLFPTVRGRLKKINGVIPAEALIEKARILRREVSLSWVAELQADNQLMAGQWWDEWQSETYGVSVESEVAELLAVKVGDSLSFELGGFELTAEIASIRKLRWDSMNPNFVFLLSPGALEGYSPSYLTSVYIAPDKKILVNELIKQHPTVVVLEIDKLIAQIQTIVNQVGRGVALVLSLVLIAGVLVMWSAIRASMDVRMKEAALLRAMGSSRKRLMAGIGAEFLSIGLVASVIAVIAAQLMINGMQLWILKTPATIDVSLLGLGFLLGCALITAMGLYACREVVNTAPNKILRSLE